MLILERLKRGKVFQNLLDRRVSFQPLTIEGLNPAHLENARGSSGSNVLSLPHTPLRKDSPMVMDMPVMGSVEGATAVSRGDDGEPDRQLLAKLSQLHEDSSEKSGSLHSIKER